MKKILLLASLFCASAYSMQEETPELKLRKIEVALKILSTPEEQLVFLCPECGSAGVREYLETYCVLCKKNFDRYSVQTELKKRAGATLVRCMQVLDNPEKK